jgi:hypothetical protein
MKQFEHGRNHTTCLTCAPTSPGLTTWKACMVAPSGEGYWRQGESEWPRSSHSAAACSYVCFQFFHSQVGDKAGRFAKRDR